MGLFEDMLAGYLPLHGKADTAGVADSATTATTSTTATNVTAANEATDTTCFPLFATAATGAVGAKTNAALKFNSNTGLLETTTIKATYLSGTTIFEEDAALHLVTALSADGKFCGITEEGVAGATLTFGQLVYKAVGDSRWELADASDPATAIGKIGICVLAAANDGSVTKVLLWGKVRADGAFPTMTIGAPVYISETAGAVVSTAPTTALAVVRIVGFANTADELFFCPGPADARLSGDVTSVGNVSTVTGISSDALVAENAGLQLDTALSATEKYCGITEEGVAGATLTFGQLVYPAAADSRWELADANATTTSVGKIGICVLAAADDAAATKVLLWGKVRADAAFPALTIGAPVHVGETAGEVQVAAPVTASTVVRIIGYGNTADELFFCPDCYYTVTAA